ncbi:MAG TPA: phytanoyl-CoA dioxygenase family protein [Stellaceae bacterium]|nr:phytanoyl-CoA dioxygenase family protein [Stellaceae bacterium]
MLNQQQIDQYRHDGYLFPLPALSAAELAECNAGLARYEAWLGTPVNQADRRWRSAGYVVLPWLDALARHPRILDVVEDLIGPDILVYTATFFIKEAHSPTFAAWHQDATYFGLDPHEHVTAWVALSDASADAGCMEVVSSQGAPRQLHHAALGLEHSINGGGQAIVERFYEGDGEMMALPAGSFSLHHTLCRHRSAPNRAGHRRVGIGISYIPAHCRLTGTVRMCARLARGHDTGGHFDLIPTPEGEFHPAAVARHEQVYRAYRDNYYEQIAAHERAFAAAPHDGGEGLPAGSPSADQFSP